ncbi:uncharacterized protein LOC103512270, partial [Diaphorina citri]|uniref:Uncharacterized protein LOC103512270 n=1 Tax=Diaphorina citri TaxID=121845 RepID=A0A1S3D671_DIACI
ENCYVKDDLGSLPVEAWCLLDGDLTQSVWETISTNRTELIKHPRSYFRWGLCIPNECTGRDLEKSLRQSLTRGFLQAGIKVTIRIPEENCYVKDDLGSLPVEAWCLLGFLGLLLVLVIWATIRDLLQSDSLSPNSARLSYSRAFSILYNTQRLCKVDKNEEMTIIYGIKFLAMTTMVIGHKVILLVGNNVQNKDRIERVDKNEEMTIIYGIKFLAMTTMVIGHKVILLVGNNVQNKDRIERVDKNEEMTIIYGIKFLAMTTMVIGHKVILLVGNNVQNKDRIERRRKVGAFSMICPDIRIIITKTSFVFGSCSANVHLQRL